MRKKKLRIHYVFNAFRFQIKRSVSGETLMRKVDLITDNAGVELISDFCLVSILIELKLTDCVTLRVKSIPLFVSDVMVKDIQLHIDELKKVCSIFIALISRTVIIRCPKC